MEQSERDERFATLLRLLGGCREVNQNEVCCLPLGHQGEHRWLSGPTDSLISSTTVDALRALVEQRIKAGLDVLSIGGLEARMSLVGDCAEMLRRNLEATRDKQGYSTLRPSHEQYLLRLAAIGFELASSGFQFKEEEPPKEQNPPAGYVTPKEEPKKQERNFPKADPSVPPSRYIRFSDVVRDSGREGSPAVGFQLTLSCGHRVTVPLEEKPNTILKRGCSTCLEEGPQTQIQYRIGTWKKGPYPAESWTAPFRAVAELVEVAGSPGDPKGRMLCVRLTCGHLVDIPPNNLLHMQVLGSPLVCGDTPPFFRTPICRCPSCQPNSSDPLRRLVLDCTKAEEPGLYRWWLECGHQQDRPHEVLRYGEPSLIVAPPAEGYVASHQLGPATTICTACGGPQKVAP